MIGRLLFLVFVVAMWFLIVFVIQPADDRIYDRCVADLVATGVPRQTAESACV